MIDSEPSWSVDFTPLEKTAEDVARADFEYKERAEHTKAQILDMAERIQNREVLTPFNAEWIAAVLRWTESMVSVERSKRRGQPSQLPGDINFHLISRMATGETEAQGIKAIAKEFGVSEQAVREKLKKMGWKNFYALGGGSLQQKK